MRAFAFALAVCLAYPALAQEPVSTQAANQALAASAEAARLKYANQSFEEYRDGLVRVPGTGSYVVNGDITIRNEKLLREFFEKNVQNKPATAASGSNTELIVQNVGGIDKIHNSNDKHRLTYCVSTAFGARHGLVVADMEAAASAWEAVADINFIYDANEDTSCNPQNNRVMFDVRPVEVGGRFYAAAFFPDDPRSQSSVVIDSSSFRIDPNNKLTLRGILRHELGHTLGLRHEHTRPDSGSCFEDNDWRVVTDYDAFSVMHYPQCNGAGDWSLRLTEADKSGIACLYGAAAGFTIDPAICGGDADSSGAPVVTTASVDLAEGAQTTIGTFEVAPGSIFKAEMTGTGDADLYVKFDIFADVSFFDCRPYSTTSNEVCELDVPLGQSFATVMVRGYKAAEATVTVTAVSP